MKINHLFLGVPTKALGTYRLILAMFVAGSSVLEQSFAEDEESTFIFQAGDQIEVSFPGAPELNRSLRVRRDGIATFPLIGEVKVAGLTTGSLEEALMAKYETQLQTNEVMVGVLDSSFSYYVEGEVNSPGKVVSFRALTALEAILEAGGYTKIAKLEVVKISRRKAGRYVFFKVNLRKILEGKSDVPFELEPFDIVSVPQKFW